MVAKTLSDAQYERMGITIVEMLKLKRIQGYTDNVPCKFLYWTQWGTKTHVEIGKMMHSLTKEYEGEHQ